MRHSLLLFCTSLALLVPGSAVAVTNGTPDGNGHSNVGALVADLPGSGLTVVCSGTLIAPKVFLTAGHCTAGLTGPVYVTFATTLDRSNWTLIPGTPVTAPGFGHDRSDPRDLGVVLLSSAPVGLAPAQLASLNTAETLNGGTVTNVGYGYYERQTGNGPPRFLYDGVRRASTSIVKSVTPSLITHRLGCLLRRFRWTAFRGADPRCGDEQWRCGVRRDEHQLSDRHTDRAGFPGELHHSPVETRAPVRLRRRFLRLPGLASPESRT